MVRFAGLLGDESWLEPLKRISTSHPSPQMRALVFVSKLRIAPELSVARPEATDRRAELIGDIVRREVENYGACLRGFEAARV